METSTTGKARDDPWRPGSNPGQGTESTRDSREEHIMLKNDPEKQGEDKGKDDYWSGGGL